MSAAVALRNVVGEAEHVFLIGIVPLHRHLDGHAGPLVVLLVRSQDYEQDIRDGNREQRLFVQTGMGVDHQHVQVQALDQIEKDDSVRVMVLTGNGKAFCAGIDVNELAGKTTIEYRAWIEHMERPLVTISQMKKPVIAQLQGVAAANGMGLVAAADLAIASERARIGYTAVKVGLFCHGPAVPLLRVLGRKLALERFQGIMGVQ